MPKEPQTLKNARNHTGGGNNRGEKRAIGSIRKLPSGRYQMRFTDPAGVVRSGGTFTTKALAESKLNQIQYQIETGAFYQAQAVEAGDLDPKTVTLSELASYWRGIRVNRKGEPLAPKTAAEYERLIESTLSDLKSKPIRSITSGQIERWWRPEYARAPRQTNAAYKHLNTLFEWAVKRKLLPANPCDIDGATSYQAARPIAPTDEQVRLMIETADERFRAVVALAAFGGLRKGEIYALTRSDIEVIDGDEQDVFVNITKSITWHDTEAIVKPPKTSGSVRVVALPPRAHEPIIQRLSEIDSKPDTLLFPRSEQENEPMRESQLRNEWERVRGIAGFSGRFHDLRTYAATEYGKTGATAAELMARFGHRDIRTAQLYQRTTGRERDLVRKLG